MSKYYLIEHVNGITTVRFSKKPTYSEVQAIIDDIAENYPYEKRLWDLTDIKFDFSMEEIQKISIYGKSKFTRPNKLAVAASDNLAYGEMRAFMAYRTQPELSTVQVFRTEQDALEWLRK